MTSALQDNDRRTPSTVDHVPRRSTYDVLADGGRMGALMRARDWSISSLGDPDRWPPSLRAIVGLMLNAKQAMFVAWGPELVFLYNDDYAPLLGAKHPAALGRPFTNVWSDIWDQINPLVERTLSGEASFHDDLLIPTERNGDREDAWFTFSYTPVRDESGAVAGMFCAVTETTAKVMAERRVATEGERLRRLFQQAPGIVCALSGPEHVFEMANASYLQLVGNREILGKPVREALPEVEGQGFVDLLDKVYTSGQPYAGEQISLMLQRTPGRPAEERFVTFIYQPIIDENGNVSGIFVEGNDVTKAKHDADALLASEARLRLAVAAGRMAVWEWDAASDIVRESPELNRMLGFPVGYQFSREETTARYFPGERERVQAAGQEALARGDRHFEVEFQYGWPGRPRWLLLRAEIMLDREGVPAGALGVLLDVTDREQARENLREREAELRAALSAGSLATYVLDHATKELRSSQGLNTIYGYPPDHSLTLADLRARYHPADLDKISSSFSVDDPAQTHFETEFRICLPDGAVRWVYGRGEYVRDAQGNRLSTRGVALDVTARKKSEEHQQLLINELNHRVKNTLATVQSIASQTLRNAASPEESKDAFEGRLMALSRVHDVLTRENWDAVSLREIATQAVEPYTSDDRTRIKIAGPAVRIPPQRALALAMALQELTTNAVKYGALSNMIGTVAITWEVEGGRNDGLLRLRWEETGGPHVHKPTRRGFGTRLIERSLSQDLGGGVRILFRPTGVVCTVEAPLL